MDTDMSGAVANEVILDLRIPPGECLRYYKGHAASIRVRARDGRIVRFPAAMLRSFVDDDGVNGSFLLRYDRDHRLISMERLPA